MEVLGRDVDEISIGSNDTTYDPKTLDNQDIDWIIKFSKAKYGDICELCLSTDKKRCFIWMGNGKVKVVYKNHNKTEFRDFYKCFDCMFNDAVKLNDNARELLTSSKLPKKNILFAICLLHRHEKPITMENIEMLCDIGEECVFRVNDNLATRIKEIDLSSYSSILYCMDSIIMCEDDDDDRMLLLQIDNDGNVTVNTDTDEIDNFIEESGNKLLFLPFEQSRSKRLPPQAPDSDYFPLDTQEIDSADEERSKKEPKIHPLSSVCGYDLSWIDCCNICIN